MGGGFSLPTSFPSLSNPFKGRNFSKGLGRGLTGDSRQTRRTSRNGSFFGQSPYQRRSMSSTPNLSVSSFLGEGIGNQLTKIGRTPTSAVISNNNKPSFVARIKDKSNNIPQQTQNQQPPPQNQNQQPPPQNQNKQLPQQNQNQQPPPQNQNQQLPQQNQNQQPPPQNQNQQLPPQTKGGSKKKPSENKKKPSKKETNPSKKETNPSKKEKKPPKKEKKPSKK